MTRLKTVRPSPSFTLAVPEEVREDDDQRVTSFWIDGEPLLLQLSSSLRYEGVQVDARTRLRERIEKSSGAWSIWSERLHPDGSIDQATAEHVDARRVRWIYTYLVWPHLTIYTTVSGPESMVSSPDNWARHAVASIALAVH